MIAHEPTALLNVRRFNKKQGGNGGGGRKWNVWYSHLRCPQCGREFVRLCNTMRGREVRCVGKDQLRMRKKESTS